MKKIVIIFAAAAMLAGCNPMRKPANNDMANVEETANSDSLNFEGVIPTADGPGIRYTIVLANDGSMGYSITRTDLEADNGKDATSHFAGKTEKISKNGREGLKFHLGEMDDEYFVQQSDSILRMVNGNLEEAASGLSYDLKRVK